MDAVEKLKYIPNYSARKSEKSQQYGKRAASGNERSQFYSGLLTEYLLIFSPMDIPLILRFPMIPADVECTKIDEVYYPEFSRAYYRDDTAR